MLASSDVQFVTFRGGLVADWTVVARLLDLEARGCSFRLRMAAGSACFHPTRLTADDLAFLRRHRDEARRVLEYQADDSHLFTDGRWRRDATASHRPGC